jgi:hypothetical protein
LNESFSLGDYIPILTGVDFERLGRFSDAGLKSSTLYANLVLPMFYQRHSSFFSELHIENTGILGGAGPTNGGKLFAIDASIGGGYRTFLGRRSVVGLYGFYDTRLFGQGAGSWTWGAEYITDLWKGTFVDFSFNQYRNRTADPTEFLEIWRKGLTDLDLEVGCSYAFLNGLGKIRLKGDHYQFTAGKRIYGYKAGIEIGSGDGRAKVGYERGYDETRGAYGAFRTKVKLGFRLEDIFKGRNPLAKWGPNPLTPKETLLRALTRKVKRRFSPAGN